MIYQTIDNILQFKKVFLESGRQNQFSYAALEALFEHLDDGAHRRLDVISLCCDYSENDLETVLKDYGLDSFEELQSNTWAVMVDENKVLYLIY